MPVDATALAHPTAPVALDLPCGRFFFSEVGSGQPITLRVSGKTAVFVGGDLDAASGFDVELGPGAELDLFVEGALANLASFSLGSPAAPGQARVYVHGASNLTLPAGARFAGNLYAPNASLVLSGQAEVFGSVFVRSLNSSGALTIHFDDAVARAGSACSP